MPGPSPERAGRGSDGRLRYSPEVGDLIALRSAHVCGGDRMVVTQVGLDVRLACAGCGARVVLSRERLRSRVRELLGGAGDAES
ncbi:MAG TPA: DUF951 domain-containing protein [Candidatus Dormibacteraeota bacterium]|nr:DUF951 domain-containing protein [Candidatus Dormibacteraeota bacterium]